MSGRTWRFRQCPQCGTVRAASEFVVDQAYRAGWHAGEIQRRCPECRFSAPTFRFKVVREARRVAT